MSKASRVGDSSSSTSARLGAVAAAGAEGFRLAARRLAGRGHALARVAGPLAQGRPGQQEQAGDEQRHDEHVDADAADDAVKAGPQALPDEPAVRRHVGVAEESLRALAAEEAEGVGGGGEHEGGGHEGDAPRDAAPRAPVVARHEHVGDEAQQQRRDEGEQPDEPAGAVARANARASRRRGRGRGRRRGTPPARRRRSPPARAGGAWRPSEAGGQPGGRCANAERGAAPARRRACLGRAVAIQVSIRRCGSVSLGRREGPLRPRRRPA